MVKSPEELEQEIEVLTADRDTWSQAVTQVMDEKDALTVRVRELEIANSHLQREHIKSIQSIRELESLLANTNRALEVERMAAVNSEGELKQALGKANGVVAYLTQRNAELERLMGEYMDRLEALGDT